MIKGVIFDLDGVLVTTDELHFQAWTRLAEEEGIPCDRSVNHRQRGIARMASLDVLLERASRSYTVAEKRAFAERKNAYYRESLSMLGPCDTLPGARDLLRALREHGILLAVGSASRNAPLIMARTDLRREVDVVVDGTHVSRSKPDPEVFLLAAQRLGLDSGECLVVEDAAAGIEAARRAGMGVLAIGSRERFPDVERVVGGLADVDASMLLT